MDPTQNLFWYFRGPGREVDQNRQLENNLTKSLIVLLSNADKRIFLRDFLRLAGIKRFEDLQFSLQRKPSIGQPRTRVVLSITGGPSEIFDSKDKKERGIPDAWIWSNSWAILVEAKIGNSLPRAQLLRHAKSQGWSRRTTVFKETTWQDLHRIFSNARRAQKLDARSDMLASHWLSYMEAMGMRKFEGWTEDDFAYFSMEPEIRGPQYRAMKTRLTDFMAQIQKSKIARRVVRLYGRSRNAEWVCGEPGKGEDLFWFNVGDEKTKGTWHLTFYVRGTGLQVEIISTSKHHNDRLAADTDLIQRMVRLLGQRRSKANPIRLRLNKAFYRDPSSARKGRFIERTEEVLSTEVGALPATSLEEFGALFSTLMAKLRKKRTFRLEVKLDCNLTVERAIGMSLREQVDWTLASMKALEPVLRELLSRS